jgi:hypothetical protein
MIYSATYTEVTIKKLLYKLKEGLSSTITTPLKFIYIQTLKLPSNQFI